MNISTTSAETPPSADPVAAESGGPDHPDRVAGGPAGGVPAGPRPRGRVRTRAVGLLWLLPAAAIGAAVHLWAARRPGAPVATVGEARLAVAALVQRGTELGTELGTGPLPIGDRLAAVQLAAAQLPLPTAGAPVVDAARWACLAFGLLVALLAWPMLRGLGISAPVSALGVALLGAGLPALALHAGVSAGAPAAAWLTLAAVCAVRQWGAAALLAALVAALTAPLAAAALLALSAHLVIGRVLRVPEQARSLLGGLLGMGAIFVAAAAVGGGPLAGAAGPVTSTPAAVAGVLAGLLVVALSWRSADWLRPVLTAATLLLVVALLPGPARTTAALLVAPILVAAAGLLVDQLAERLPGRPLRAAGATGLLLAILLPTMAVLAARTPPPDQRALVAWLATQPAPGTVLRADELDRAELLAAGVPAGRLRSVADPAVPNELRLVSARPGGLPSVAVAASCTGPDVLARADRGTAGAPGAVCRTDGGAAGVAAEQPRRVRFGAALADNSALRPSPAAAAALRAGEVDPRLMLVLTALTTAHRVAVEDFPAVPLDAPGLPRRQALLTVVDGDAAVSADLLSGWLTAQRPPFAPSVVEPAGTALLVGYPAPVTSGLLPD